jgi:hypothetical protein
MRKILLSFLTVYDAGLAPGKWGVPVVWSVDLLQVRVMLNIMRMLRLHMVEDTTSLLPPDILSGTATTLKVYDLKVQPHEIYY